MTDALDNVTPAAELSTASAPASDVGDAWSERSIILAWLASVGVHIVLFTVMVMLPWIHETMGRPDGPEIAVTDLLDIPAQTKFSMAPLESTLAPNRQLEKPSTHIAPEKQNTLRELTEVRQTKLSIVGIGTGGGEFAKYGLHVGSGGAGPKFFGLGGEARAARRIVYVVDRSGSMLGIFDDLRREIKRSIDSLRKSQKYHLIFYSSDPPLESPPGKLVNAIRANKERTFEFVDDTFPQGMTQPIEAMRRAFELKPDLVYFLSDGDIPEAELLKEKLREWNHAERVRIFTIAYISAAGRGLLEDIAREHNGSFRFVSEYELGG